MIILTISSKPSDSWNGLTTSYPPGPYLLVDYLQTKGTQLGTALPAPDERLPGVRTTTRTLTSLTRI